MIENNRMTPNACDRTPTMSNIALLVKKYLCGERLSTQERVFLRLSLEMVPPANPRLPPTLGLPDCISRRSLEALGRMTPDARLEQAVTGNCNELDALKYLLAQSGIPIMETLFHSRVD